MSDLIWLSEAQMRRIEPYFPLSHGVPRVDDRRIISGIIFVIRNGLRWRDAPSDYGPHKTIYNRFVRWSRMGVFNKIFAAILVAGIIASLTGFISHKLVHPHALPENAYKIEGVADNAGGGPVVVAKAEPVLALLANADIAKGEQSAKVCATCHSFVKGGANAIGPGLWDVVKIGRASCRERV